MNKICSWCRTKIGWDVDLKDESHGICQKCLLKFFPKEAHRLLKK